LGETVVVTGLGLIGLVTVQLLRAHGCRVLGLDFDSEKLAMARAFGAQTVNLAQGEDPVAAAQAFTRGRGVDAVIITAATKSNEPVHQGALMCRKRGRIVLVGVTGLELSRADFFEKELTFQVSCSYGPGRYDVNYEEKGNDYPVGFVRWTEQRNFEAVLDMMSDGRLDVKPLISHRYKIDNALEAYELIGGSAPSLGIVLEYPEQTGEAARELAAQTVTLPVKGPAQAAGAGGASGAGSIQVSVAFIGSGNYAVGALIPAFKETGATLRTVASSGGVSGLHAARKFGFATTTTDTESVFADTQVNAVVITTRHDNHADMVCRALNAGKHVFVEKPLALTLEQIDRIEEAYASAQTGGAKPIVMVGFNRRFAPQVQRMKTLLAAVNTPKSFIMTVNAGAIPADHWTQDALAGGGRIVGEACHFIDLIRFLAGSPFVSHSVSAMKANTQDTVSIELRLEDGSIGTVHYFANGTKAFPKERLEVFAAGRVLQLDNFRRMRGFAWPGFSKMNLWRQDKGQRACASAFVRAIQNGTASPIPMPELLEVARATVQIANQHQH
jgi:predicted dehydrogenase